MTHEVQDQLENQTEKIETLGRYSTLVASIQNLDIRPTLPPWISRFLGYSKNGERHPIWLLRWLDVLKIPICVEEFLSACFCTFAALACLSQVNLHSALSHLPIPVIYGPAGATAILLFTLPHSPASTPRSLLLGHLSASSISTILTQTILTFPEELQLSNQHNIATKIWLCSCASLTISLAFQIATNSVHPPGGAIALVGTSTPGLVKIGWAYIGWVMSEAFILLAFALFFGNIGRRTYPLYWWLPSKT
ncbi:hypothetical protein O181_036304 [Austropuccinia psidii MF-1]|uniref:HPP transmembrane region domain-containing protein n=1 Tax=Austropuccinia psidii MF-1 TaxID=1389203 RepID=A0A9Q3D4F0_9BASI|nr:hypothetical protein [Austropuccinia psidii MF-1]